MDQAFEGLLRTGGVLRDIKGLLRDIKGGILRDISGYTCLLPVKFGRYIKQTKIKSLT